MRAVLQRVREARVSVSGRTIAQIGRGVVILVGVGAADTPDEARWMAEKCATLRIFEDAQGKTNLALGDVGGEALVVSQFTLYADARKGRRPSFVDAAPPERAEPLVRLFAEHLASEGVPTQQGAFGAHMLVEIANDGPVTILLERGGSAEATE
jgi:D-tyrosyl-tRNA(Tyr) deacylase